MRHGYWNLPKDIWHLFFVWRQIFHRDHRRLLQVPREHPSKMKQIKEILMNRTNVCSKSHSQGQGVGERLQEWICTSFHWRIQGGGGGGLGGYNAPIPRAAPRKAKNRRKPCTLSGMGKCPTPLTKSWIRHRFPPLPFRSHFKVNCPSLPSNSFNSVEL